MSQVTCTQCQRINRLGAKFCSTCGNLLPSQPQPDPWGGYPANLGTGMLSTNSMVNNRYLIVQKVGQGGMGAVYKVTDTHNNHQILALKEMSDSAIDPADRPQMLAQFEQEARLLQQLSHPNLPYVTDKFSTGDRHYLVMEFINGRTLQQMLDDAQQPFPESLVALWAGQLCAVLGYLHSQNPKIIFRDLKPDNIMVTADNQVKLIDFGIVRFFKPGKKKDTIMLGTKGYAAPEQFGTGQTDERSDIYSLGATLFHLLTAVDPETHLFKIPSVRQFNPTISLQMDQLVSRATRYNAQERFPSMQQMRVGLPANGQQTPSSGPTISNNLPGNQANGPLKATARPTTRLVQATAKLTAQMTNQQLIMAGAALLAVILLVVWVVAPRIQGTWFWYRMPTIALLGPLIFAATRRPAVAGIGHAVIVVVAGALTWYRVGMTGDYGALFLGALVSAGAIEAGVYLLPRITAGLKRDDPGNWKREAAWLGGIALVGNILLTGFTFGWDIAFRPDTLILSFILGGVGWFAGDLIYSAWEEKQTRI